MSVILDIPWAQLSAMVAFFIGITVLIAKWVPGLNRLTSSWISWVGGLFTATLQAELRSLIDKFDTHVNDPDAHSRLNHEEEVVIYGPKDGPV